MSEKQGKGISTLLLTLLVATKERRQEDIEFGKEFVATALADLYSSEMSLSDCLLLTINAFEELKQEPRFQAGWHTTHDLLLAPAKGNYSPLGFFNSKLSSTLSLEQLYDSFFKFMLSAIHLSAIGWCRDELDAHKEKMQVEKAERAARLEAVE